MIIFINDIPVKTNADLTQNTLMMHKIEFHINSCIQQGDWSGAILGKWWIIPYEYRAHKRKISIAVSKFTCASHPEVLRSRLARYPKCNTQLHKKN